MSTINEQMEEAHETLTENNVVAIRRGLSLVGGGGSIGTNWLYELIPVGGVFLSRPTKGDGEHSRAQLMAFEVDWKMEDGFAVRMHSILNHPVDFFVDSVVFSEENTLYAWKGPED